MSTGSSPHKLGKVGPKHRTVDVKKVTSQIIEVAHGGFHNINQLQLDDFRVSCSEKKESKDLMSQMFSYVCQKHVSASEKDIILNSFL